MKLLNRVLIAGLALGFFPSTTHVSNFFINQSIAGSTSTTITVSATVPVNCNFTGGSAALAFGTYDPINANATQDLDSTTSVSIRCTKGTTAVFTMNNGNNANGAQRRMVNDTSDYLNYQVYTNGSYSTIWDTTNTVTYIAPNNGTAQIPIYGRIPAGQNVTSGSYNDVVTITATY